MGRTHRTYINTSTRIFTCARCKVHLAAIDDMISRQFQGQHGRAYLFVKAVNVKLGPAEDRNMTTGLHTVRDINCDKCSATLGWKYDKAFEASQKYKEGKYILERALLSEVVPEQFDLASLDAKVEITSGDLGSDTSSSSSLQSRS